MTTLGGWAAGPGGLPSDCEGDVRYVAREAEVSEQTVYNYFQTKEQLVTDRDQLVQDELSRRIRTRAPGTTPAAAIRDFVLDTVEGIRRIPAGQWRGELGFLAAISPTVHRLSLEMSERQASALAAAITETEAIGPEIAKLRGIALAGVFQIIITEAGRRTREGQSQDQIADQLRPASKRSSTTSTAGLPQLRTRTAGSRRTAAGGVTGGTMRSLPPQWACLCGWVCGRWCRRLGWISAGLRF